MRFKNFSLNIILFLYFFSFISLAQNKEIHDEIKPEVYKDSNDLAVNGYDIVAYFSESKPVMGKPEYKFSWMRAEWQFSNEKNLNMFKENPEKYAPQYGGWCAYGMSNGYKATTSPDAWTVVNKKLYLNYDTNVRDLWKKDQKSFIKKADVNWPKLIYK